MYSIFRVWLEATQSYEFAERLLRELRLAQGNRRECLTNLGKAWMHVAAKFVGSVAVYLPVVEGKLDGRVGDVFTSTPFRELQLETGVGVAQIDGLLPVGSDQQARRV